LSGLNEPVGPIAYGRLDVNPSENLFPLSPLSRRLVKGKDYAAIFYGLEEKFRVQEYLRKGIGTRILKSLEEMARESRLKIMIGLVASDNKESIGALRKRGFNRLGRSNYYYKLLK
jgi:ribosomal protein S18 acetylase RimI-like enzyme